MLPLSLNKRTCRLVHVSHTRDSSGWWSLKKCRPVRNEMVSLNLNFRSLAMPSIDIFVLCSLGGGFH